MYYSNIALAAFIASAAAVALPSVRLDSLTKRAGDEHVFNSNGNIKITMSKETVNIGALNIDEIHDTLASVCHENGQCETNPVVKKARSIHGQTDQKDLIITLSPDGEYPTWIRNALVDMLFAAGKAAMKCENGQYTDMCPGVTAMAYCPQRKIKFVNCAVPQYWGINYQAPDAANAAPPNIDMGIDVEVVKQDLCTPLMTTGSAIAGLANPYAGAGMSVLSLVCQ